MGTFGGEQLVPIILAIGLPILHEEGECAKGFATVGAAKAVRMPFVAQGIQARFGERQRAFVAHGSQQNFIALWAVVSSAGRVLDEAAVQQRPGTGGICAAKVVGAPGTALGQHKGAMKFQATMFTSILVGSSSARLWLLLLLLLLDDQRCTFAAVAAAQPIPTLLLLSTISRMLVCFVGFVQKSVALMAAAVVAYLIVVVVVLAQNFG